MLLNNLWSHLCYEDDGHLVHTDKRTGAKRISLETWPDVTSAKEAVAVKLSKIEWEELKEPPPADPVKLLRHYRPRRAGAITFLPKKFRCHASMHGGSFH